MKAVDCSQDDKGLHDVCQIKKIVLHAKEDFSSIDINSWWIPSAIYHQKNQQKNVDEHLASVPRNGGFHHSNLLISLLFQVLVTLSKK